MYKSPIELIQTDLSLKLEGETVKAVQQCGFNIDIEELTKALLYDRDQYHKGYADALETIPKWIPVTERLPEQKGYYLVFSHGVIGTAYYGSKWWTEDPRIYEPKITHWMPMLPKPPKDGV